ncbi:MAG: hypothetical protein H0X64_10690 [Gemmatimonadaceae bacterium]|nr:hypothetical protein [Gemmatimonadaceae bacterium]
MKHALVIGLYLIAFGTGLVVFEAMKTAPHSGHLYLYAGFVGVGLLLAVARALGDSVKIVIVPLVTAVGPYMPFGRRAYDQPSPPVVPPDPPAPPPDAP